MTSTSNRIVVAGGGGFIGRALCSVLLGAGYRVSVLTRGPAREGPNGLSFVTWDGVSPRGWEDQADGALALVNLAGENVAGGRWTAARRRAILESRVLAGRAMAQAVERAAQKPKVLVQASAVGYYGDTGDALVDETRPGGQGFLAEVCRQWEASSRAVEDMGVRRVVVRTGLVLGRGGGMLERVLTPFRLFLGGPLGGGRQGFSWIHLEDEVRAIRFLLEDERATGPFNLTAPGSVTNLEFCRELGRVLSRPCALPAPGALLELVLGDMGRELLLWGCRALPRRLLELGFAFTYPELGGALRALLR